MEFRMIAQFRQVLAAQFYAGLCMLEDCLRKCPDEHWDGRIAKYPFWQVAYHALCYVDAYLAPHNDAWQPRTEPGGLHPRGRAELDDEYPSRRFERQELIGYVALCRKKVLEALAAESPASLAGTSGFSHLPFSRAELHLYNLRHLGHHTGQLSAYVHRLDLPALWVKTGWR
jgi:hypothetical protein